jgi:hypothetical protein
MFASDDLTFGVDGAPPLLDLGSPGIDALAAALERLVAASDAVTHAVTGHDHDGLVAANERADGLLAEVGRLTAALTPDDQALLPRTAVPGLCRRLGIAARRNAVLIESAWAVDAALMRLLLGAGRNGSENAVAGYGTSSGPAYLDRQA